MAIDVDLDQIFHNTAAALRDTLGYAHSIESDGECIETLGRAVTLARELVAIEDALRLTNGDVHETYVTGHHDDIGLASRIADFAKRSERRTKQATAYPRSNLLGNDRTNNRM